MSPSISRLSRDTSLTTSPTRTVELFQTGSTSVVDTTYLGSRLSRSAHGPRRPFHRRPKKSSLLRPSNTASALIASSYSVVAHASRSASLISSNQPPRVKPCSPVGSWSTPSCVTFSLTTIFPMDSSPHPYQQVVTDTDT